MDTLTDQQKLDLAKLGNHELDTLGTDFKDFALYLWSLSHKGKLDTFSYQGSDPTFLSLLHTSGVLELVDRVGDRYRIRFTLQWLKWLQYTELVNEVNKR